MNTLSGKTCQACRKGATPASPEETVSYMAQLPGWYVIEVNETKRLEKRFKFKNFAQALRFTNLVGDVADQENHHPVIVTEWGQVTVIWWTHVIGGLHINDFIMAAKTDTIYAEG